MKLIALNTWGGKIYKPLTNFIKDKSKDIDIFCFQEVLARGKGFTNKDEVKSLYEDISEILINHHGYFAEYGNGGYYSESSKNLDFRYGIATFVKRELEQKAVGNILLVDSDKKWSDYDGKFAAGASLAVNVSGYTVVNVHGMWQNVGKIDTQARIEQSKKIINLASKTNKEKIYCGDFNLGPDTRSIKMLEEKTVNLIKKFGITSTRSELYKKTGKFADYVFISPEIEVKHFEVLTNEVSDHLPLLLHYDKS